MDPSKLDTTVSIKGPSCSGEGLTNETACPTDKGFEYFYDEEDKMGYCYKMGGAEMTAETCAEEYPDGTFFGGETCGNVDKVGPPSDETCKDGDWLEIAALCCGVPENVACASDTPDDGKGDKDDHDDHDHGDKDDAHDKEDDAMMEQMVMGMTQMITSLPGVTASEGCVTCFATSMATMMRARRLAEHEDAAMMMMMMLPEAAADAACQKEDFLSIMEAMEAMSADPPASDGDHEDHEDHDDEGPSEEEMEMMSGLFSCLGYDAETMADVIEMASTGGCASACDAPPTTCDGLETALSGCASGCTEDDFMVERLRVTLDCPVTPAPTPAPAPEADSVAAALTLAVIFS